MTKEIDDLKKAIELAETSTEQLKKSQMSLDFSAPTEPHHKEYTRTSRSGKVSQIAAKGPATVKEQKAALKDALEHSRHAFSTDKYADHQKALEAHKAAHEKATDPEIKQKHEDYIRMHGVESSVAPDRPATQKATEASREAQRASDKAHADKNNILSHKLASDAHTRAATAHNLARDMSVDKKAAGEHHEASGRHLELAKEHQRAAAKIHRDNP